MSTRAIFTPTACTHVAKRPRILSGASLLLGAPVCAQALADWRKEHRQWLEVKKPMFIAEEGAMALLRATSSHDGAASDAQPAQASDHDVARDIEHHSSEYIAMQRSREMAAFHEKMRQGFKGLPLRWSEYSKMSQDQKDSNETYRAHGPPRPVFKLLPNDKELIVMFQSARASESAA